MTARGFLPGRRWWMRVFVLLGLLMGGWGGGFLWFLHMTGRPATPILSADGIVVLTGGADRIESALRMLAEGHGKRLLISGIGGGADLAVLARHSGVDTTALAQRITLGRQATSTLGNAREAAAWVQSNKIESLIVVTASYHMPRAMTELRRALPGTVLIAEPVTHQGNPGRAEAGRGAPLRLLAEEYTKDLISLTGLTAWIPSRDAAANAGHAG